MAGLVGYASSDEEDETEHQAPEEVGFKRIFFWNFHGPLIRSIEAGAAGSY